MKPCANQNKPIDRHFLAKNINSATMLTVLRHAQLMAKNQVPGFSLSALIATVFTEALVVHGQSMKSDLHNRIVQKRLLATLIKILGSKAQASSPNPLVELQSAILVVLMSACKVGIVQNSDAEQLLIFTLSRVMRRLSRKGLIKSSKRCEDLYRGIVATLAFVVCACEVSELEAEVLLNLARLEVFLRDLSEIVPPTSRRREYFALVFARSLAVSAIEDDECFDWFQKVLDGSSGPVSNPIKVQSLISFLNKCDDEKCNKKGKKKLMRNIVALLQATVRAQDEKLVNLAVTRHMTYRKQTDKGFACVDAALLKIFRGTNGDIFQITLSDWDEVTTESLTAALNHPVDAIRVAAVRKFEYLRSSE